MQKTILSRLFYLSFFLVLTSFSNSTTRATTAPLVLSANVDANDANAELSSAAALYSQMELESRGLQQEVFEAAVRGYEKLLSSGVIKNQQYLTIVDLGQSSRRKRLYLLDMEHHQVVVHTFVSHGKNSGVDKAERFSNIPESEQSSLGFYVTKNTYFGKHGLSLKLAGLEAGFNDRAESRAIVVHGAEYVNAARVNSGYMGRSQGCPAVPVEESTKIIKMIKDGTALFIYHPTERYVKHSKLLNS
ncbi:MAG TPA: murein L,D-transpeptidase catalytic domain family protein [Chitinophagaceae bacterium]|nr:murein L,D-transpeptidase catalytic domain family protein [Chitinophagaceae bacterium]